MRQSQFHMFRIITTPNVIRPIHILLIFLVFVAILKALCHYQSQLSSMDQKSKSEVKTKLSSYFFRPISSSVTIITFVSITVTLCELIVFFFFFILHFSSIFREELIVYLIFCLQPRRIILWYVRSQKECDMKLFVLAFTIQFTCR